MEAGYLEKVDELCGRYSLEGFVKAKGKQNWLVFKFNITLNHIRYSTQLIFNSAGVFSFCSPRFFDC